MADASRERLLLATCKNCKRPITYSQGDNGLWFEKTHDVQLGAQYCWMDPQHGSQLHEPNPDTIKEK